MARRSILTNVWKPVLVTLLCLGLLSACEDSAPTASPGRTGSLVQDLEWAPVQLSERCPPIHQPLSYAPGGVLPKGANVVRLCNGIAVGGNTSGAPSRYDVPSDILTTDVASLIEQVNGLRPPAPPTANDGQVYCPADGGIALNFWFGYADGTAAAIAWHPYGCRLLRLAPGRTVEGGRSVLASFAREIAKQRASSRFVADPPAPRCDPRAQPTSPLGYRSLGDLSGIRICILGQSGPGAKVPAALVRRINRQTDPNHRGRGCVDRGRLWLRATTAFGDHVDFYPDGCAWTLPVLPDTPDPYPSWRPSRSLARALRHLAPSTQ